MIEEQGTVVSACGDLVEVRTERRDACGACDARRGCATSLLDRFLGRRVVTLRARNPVGAAVGDQVVIGVSESGLLVASLAAYLVPVLGLLVGGVTGQWLGQGFGQPGVQAGAQGLGSDHSALLGSVLGFVLALFWLRRYSGRRARGSSLQPLVLRRLSGGGTLDGTTPETGHPGAGASPCPPGRPPTPVDRTAEFP